jgi:hypothetical protein
MKTKSELQADLAKLCDRIAAFTNELNTMRRGDVGAVPAEVTLDVLKECLFEKTAILEQIKKLENDVEQTRLPAPLSTATTTPITRISSLGAFGFTIRDKNTGQAVKLSDQPVLLATVLPHCKGCLKTFKTPEGLVGHAPYCPKEKARTTALYREVHERNTKDDIEMMRESLEAASETEDEATDREDAPQKHGRRGSDFRKRYHPLFKLRVVKIAQSLKQTGCAAPLRVAAEITNLAEANICRWMKERDKHERDALICAGKKGRGFSGRLIFCSPRGRQTKYEAAENALMIKFDKARKEGKRVGFNIMRTWMLRLVAELYADQPLLRNGFKGSHSWFQGLVSRQGLTFRRATNKKQLSVEERLPKVQRWHNRWRYYISRGPQVDPIFGRFKPQFILNADQSPLCLTEANTTTWNRKGEKLVRIAFKESADKRYCTLQLCICLENGVKQCRVAIIFKGQGKRISQEERSGWHKDVDVYFQKKAWMDTDTLQAWTQRTLKPFVESLGQGRKCLILDNLRAQTMDSVKDDLLAINVERRLFPAGCTDIMQPIDRHLAKQLKSRIGTLFDEILVNDDDFAASWYGLTDGTYPAWKCRVLVTQLVGRAWNDVCKERDFLHLGLETGCVMPKEGVNRISHGLSNVKIDGIADYAFEHVPLGEPLPDLGDEDRVEAENIIPAVATSTAAATVQTVVTLPAIESSEEDTSDGENEEPITTLAPKRRLPTAPKRRKTTGAPASENDLEEDGLVDYDMRALNDIYEDETFIPDDATPQPKAPEGMRLAHKPVDVKPSRLLNRMVIWSVLLDATGSSGWIVSQIRGGPLSPQDAAQGITLRLKCSSDLDRNSPNHLCGKHSPISVAFTLENYAERWYLLENSN